MNIDKEYTDMFDNYLRTADYSLSDYSKSDILRYPGRLNYKTIRALIVIGILLFSVLAFIIFKWGSKDFQFFSNFFLSISTGLFASYLIMEFTNKIYKVQNYMTMGFDELIKISEPISEGLHKSTVEFSRSYGDIDKAYLHMKFVTNASIMLYEYYDRINLLYNRKEFKKHYDVAKRIGDELFEKYTKIYNPEYIKDKTTFSKNLKEYINFCSLQCNTLSITLSQMVQDLEDLKSKILDVTLGKKTDFSKFDKSKKNKI